MYIALQKNKPLSTNLVDDEEEQYQYYLMKY